ncbi:hypothetical protein BDZ91DRAFT_789380 [Kalaharituber pfeilii]|nr:hypothetical protein BDZ91DRAFT_789380 [Kalaharituber pfeilii]
MEAFMMPTCQPDLELESTALFPLTVTNPTFIFPTAIALGPSIQGASQFLICIPPGFEPRGIVCSRTTLGGPETLSDTVPGILGGQHSYAQNRYTCACNQLPVLVNDLFPGYEMIVTGDTIYESVFDGLFSAVPAPSNNYPEMVNYPMSECLLDENQSSPALETFNRIIDQRDDHIHFDGQNAPPIPHAAPLASPQSSGILWMSPNIPNDFVPAPSFPENGIRFEEPTIFAEAHPLNDRQRVWTTFKPTDSIMLFHVFR